MTPSFTKAALAAAPLAAAAGASAQAWPARPVTIFVPFPAGGTTREDKADPQADQRAGAVHQVAGRRQPGRVPVGSSASLRWPHSGGVGRIAKAFFDMTPHSLPAQAFGLLGWLVVAFAAAALGAIASVDAAAFYAQLVKPPWAPPAWLFGPVWSVLYALMGVAAWLVWRSPRPRKAALALFGVQLAANALWSWLFFAWHLGALATLDVAVLLALIAWTAAAFRRSSPLAAALLVPYLLWVGFAAMLTWRVWQGNPGVL